MNWAVPPAPTPHPRKEQTGVRILSRPGTYPSTRYPPPATPRTGRAGLLKLYGGCDSIGCRTSPPELYLPPPHGDGVGAGRSRAPLAGSVDLALANAARLLAGQRSLSPPSPKPRNPLALAVTPRILPRGLGPEAPIPSRSLGGGAPPSHASLAKTRSDIRPVLDTLLASCSSVRAYAHQNRRYPTGGLALQATICSHPCSHGGLHAADKASPILAAASLPPSSPGTATVVPVVRVCVRLAITGTPLARVPGRNPWLPGIPAGLPTLVVPSPTEPKTASRWLRWGNTSCVT